MDTRNKKILNIPEVQKIHMQQCTLVSFSKSKRCVAVFFLNGNSFTLSPLVWEAWLEKQHCTAP
jgi:hypothetical protein